MKISADKKQVLTRLLAWHQAPNKPQYITLGGYAGTGKTTLISIFRTILKAKQPNVKVAFVSYTGKATRILKNKLQEADALSTQDSVSTIHSLIYSPIVNSANEIIGWERRETIEKDLLIIDEASMVSGEIWRDLLSYKIPIFAVGDHGQLPPIEGRFNLMEKPDLALTQIHRQVRDNPIIKVSKMAREQGFIPFNNYGKTVMKLDKTAWETQETITQLLEQYDENTIILCGYNNTRVKINAQIRQFLGYQTPYPEHGDRVICLRNNHDHGIFNGMLGQIAHIENLDEQWYHAKITMEDGFDFEGPILKEQFNSPKPVNFTKKRKDSLRGDLFDFGYAMTVHKAQGSQAKRVILFEERFRQMDDERWKRWLYTAVTRAEEDLYIVGDLQRISNKQDKGPQKQNNPI
jgi:exodeoxyribonuclease V